MAQASKDEKHSGHSSSQSNLWSLQTMSAWNCQKKGLVAVCMLNVSPMFLFHATFWMPTRSLGIEGEPTRNQTEMSRSLSRHLQQSRHSRKSSWKNTLWSSKPVFVLADQGSCLVVAAILCVSVCFPGSKTLPPIIRQFCVATVIIRGIWMGLLL